MGEILYERDSTSSFDPRHAIFEQPLADPGTDQGLACGVWDFSIDHPTLFNVLPLLLTSELTFDQGNIASDGIPPPKDGGFTGQPHDELGEPCRDRGQVDVL
jgi:hypothetical protein